MVLNSYIYAVPKKYHKIRTKYIVRELKKENNGGIGEEISQWIGNYVLHDWMLSLYKDRSGRSVDTFNGEYLELHKRDLKRLEQNLNAGLLDDDGFWTKEQVLENRRQLLVCVAVCKYILQIKKRLFYFACC